MDSVVTIMMGYGVPAQSERAFQAMKQVATTRVTASNSFSVERMIVYDQIFVPEKYLPKPAGAFRKLTDRQYVRASRSRSGRSIAST